MNEIFLVIRFKSTFDRIHKIDSAETRIGRDGGCGICLSDVLVSRNHALLLKSEDNCHIRDLQSRNGTRLNGSLIQGDEPLTDGSEVQIGSYVFQVCSSFGAAVAQTGSTDDSTRTKHESGVAVSQKDDRLSTLTPAQRRVYDLLVQGLIEKEVATNLRISVHTVHDHSKAIYRVLSVSTRGELISRWATKHDG